MSKYDFTSSMGEISGFGGGYEATCRAMLKAGLEWFDLHPDAKPMFHKFEGVYGIIAEENQDAKDLSEAVVRGGGDDCTGAMHQAVISHVLFIKKNGWDEFVKKMSRRSKEN